MLIIVCTTTTGKESYSNKNTDVTWGIAHSIPATFWGHFLPYSLYQLQSSSALEIPIQSVKREGLN